jgi:hypothetical protein
MPRCLDLTECEQAGVVWNHHVFAETAVASKMLRDELVLPRTIRTTSAGLRISRPKQERYFAFILSPLTKTPRDLVYSS